MCNKLTRDYFTFLNFFSSENSLSGSKIQLKKQWSDCQEMWASFLFENNLAFFCTLTYSSSSEEYEEKDINNFLSKNQINMGTKTRPCCKLSSEGNIYIDWLSDQYKCLIGKRYLDQEINWLDAIYRHICNYWWESTFKFTKTIVTV